LQKEALALKVIRSKMGEEDFPGIVFRKVRLPKAEDLLIAFISWSSQVLSRCLYFLFIFLQIYEEDIHRLVSMTNLWKARAPPTALSFDDLQKPGGEDASNGNYSGLKDQKVLSVRENFELFLSMCVVDAGFCVFEYCYATSAPSRSDPHIFFFSSLSRADVDSFAGCVRYPQGSPLKIWTRFLLTRTMMRF
jgi:hypothetical protein